LRVVAEIMASLTTASRSPAPSVSEPCKTSTVPAERRTPHPRTEAKVSAAMKSRELFRARGL
jgi:hypothetical protein